MQLCEYCGSEIHPGDKKCCFCGVESTYRSRNQKVTYNTNRETVHRDNSYNAYDNFPNDSKKYKSGGYTVSRGDFSGKGNSEETKEKYIVLKAIIIFIIASSIIPSILGMVMYWLAYFRMSGLW